MARPRTTATPALADKPKTARAQRGACYRHTLTSGLVGLPACDDLRRRGDLLIAALDPCVPCHVMIEEHAGA